MNRHTDQKCVSQWTAAGIATIATLWVGCSGSIADGAPPEAVRSAAEQHVGEAGGEMTFDDPTGDGRLTLAFDHVHDGVHATEGGRQVVCVDFKSADGTVYDVDFYVDRAGTTDTLVVEDTVIHKVSGKNALSDARRGELNRKG